jgi:hypothetical protein
MCHVTIAQHEKKNKTIQLTVFREISTSRLQDCLSAASHNGTFKPDEYQIKIGDVCEYTGTKLGARLNHGRCYKYNNFYIAKMCV